MEWDIRGGEGSHRVIGTWRIGNQIKFRDWQFSARSLIRSQVQQQVGCKKLQD